MRQATQTYQYGFVRKPDDGAQYLHKSGFASEGDMEYKVNRKVKCRKHEDFICGKVRRRNDPSFPLTPTLSKTSNQFPKHEQPERKMRNAKRQVSTHKTDVTANCSTSPMDSSSYKPDDVGKQCPIHQKPHPLKKCRGFRSKPLEVHTAQNPADHATRSVPATELTNTIWLTGPAFLSLAGGVPSPEEEHHKLVNPDSDSEAMPQLSPSLHLSWDLIVSSGSPHGAKISTASSGGRCNISPTPFGTDGGVSTFPRSRVTASSRTSDLVLLKNNQVKRNEWPLALVKTFPDQDGKVRKIELKVTRSGSAKTFLKPVSETVLLMAAKNTD
ncbi:hypothetical protein L3Q82_019236 [Scortum barcoo]|uniref:Uncharacterized protein n=1 Tax=Scortum barcoo TaxID=214431 RepID=A0ACB8VBD2_9TELE|nr:hypothetical protein L3Q82_019236 [Scortum barcoo]